MLLNQALLHAIVEKQIVDHQKSPTAPAEVHKYSISISIQIFTGGGGPQRYTNILFLFLFRFSPTAAAHGGTQIFYSNLRQIDYSRQTVY